MDVELPKVFIQLFTPAVFPFDADSVSKLVFMDELLNDGAADRRCFRFSLSMLRVALINSEVYYTWRATVVSKRTFGDSCAVSVWLKCTSKGFSTINFWLSLTFAEGLARGTPSSIVATLDDDLCQDAYYFLHLMNEEKVL